MTACQSKTSRAWLQWAVFISISNHGKYLQSSNSTGSTWYFPLTVHHRSRSHQGLPISSRAAAVRGTNVGTPRSASGTEMATTREAMESKRQRLGKDFNQMWSGFGANTGFPACFSMFWFFDPLANFLYQMVEHAPHIKPFFYRELWMISWMG